MKISWALIAAYVIFWLWYTPLGGPLTANEIDQYVATLEARNADKAAIKQLRAFAENDDGGSFIMVNALDLKDTLEPLSGMPADSAADDVMDVYVEHIFPALFARASHPVIAGDAIFTAMDIVGIEGAESWDSAGLVRYRSKRDLLEIASNPAFGEKHDYKVAALEKTIAFPITTRMNLGDPRLILGLLTIIGVLLARRS
ncbi:MAG: hypothetical protein CBB81_01770 [Cellvibrionales bacterium TMED21]|nr:hypothetical protein [Halieaceae bacterium]OUT67122.1 MAG: hypothetical protein CBB81_01770 [Cellvibrionales bacterium TMED21]